MIENRTHTESGSETLPPEAVDTSLVDFPLTIRHLLYRARATNAGGEVVCASSGEIVRVSYAEFARRVAQLMQVIRDMGVRPGERVATLAWNSLEHLELMFAVPAIGGVLHPLNPRLPGPDLRYTAEHGGAELLFADPSALATAGINDPRSELGMKDIVLTDEMRRLADAVGAIEELEPLEEHAAAVLTYTSGTTGRPKGVLHSHRALVLHAVVQCTADAAGIGYGDRVLPAAPIFHVNAWGLPFSAALSGASLILPGHDVSAAKLVDLIKTERVSVAAAVPTIWQDVLASTALTRSDLTTLRMILTGGAPVPRALMKRFHDEFAVDVVQAWGMTETLSCTTYGHSKEPVDSEEHWLEREAAGRLVPLVEARLVDDGGGPVSASGSNRGHLEVRGAFIATSYVGDDLAGTGEWLATGDIASLDDRGVMRVVDRAKDLIKSGGEWIASAALEAKIMEHGDVLAVAVVRRPDDRWGERPVAFVVVDGATSLSCDALRAHLTSRVPRWWIPEDWVFVDALPHTGAGKTDKQALRARAETPDRAMATGTGHDD